MISDVAVRRAVLPFAISFMFSVSSYTLASCASAGPLQPSTTASISTRNPNRVAISGVLLVARARMGEGVTESVGPRP